MIRLLHRGFNYSQDRTREPAGLSSQGCNLHCPWCSNPESIALSGSLMVPDSGALKPDACPFGAISLGRLNRLLCRTARKSLAPSCGAAV